MFGLRQLIPDDQVTYLPHLIAFRLSARKWLKVQNFDDVFPAENVVVTTHSFAEPKTEEERAKWLEWNVLIRTAGQNLREQLGLPTHVQTIACLSPPNVPSSPARTARAEV